MPATQNRARIHAILHFVGRIEDFEYAPGADRSIRNSGADLRELVEWFKHLAQVSEKYQQFSETQG